MTSASHANEPALGVVVRDVTKNFGAFTALGNVNLEIAAGGLTALLGPSGSGKTTLLRILAGLEFPDAGAVYYGGEDVTHTKAGQRNVGFVFQHYALFRHMNVYENVAFGLRVRGRSNNEVDKVVRELLRLVRLEAYDKRLPSQLSGGQRQRIALARALAVQPRVLLLDEPFGALDAKVRVELRQWLRRLHNEIPVTTVLVTHDQEEAFETADRVVVMNHGKVEQVGAPHELFDHPATPFVMDFIGEVNVFHGRVAQGRVWLGNLELPTLNGVGRSGDTARVYVRPHEWEVDNVRPDRAHLAAQVTHVNAAGALARLRLFVPDHELALSAAVPRERCRQLGLEAGQTVFVFPKQSRVFSPEYAI